MTLLGGFLSMAAVAAAVAAVVQLARQAKQLREEIEEVRARLPPAPAAMPGTSGRPIFGELWEDKPGALEGIAGWPGVPFALAAAGLVAVGLFVQQPVQPAADAADSTIALDIAAARAQYDSLAREVSTMRDSMTVLRQRPAAPSRVASREHSPRTVERTAMAPLPSLPKIDP